jgi:hypothetical protein
MSPETQGSPAGRTSQAGLSAATASKQDHWHRTAAENEVGVRVHSVAVVSQAMKEGRWESDVATLDALSCLCSAAARWALVVELELVA